MLKDTVKKRGRPRAKQLLKRMLFNIYCNTTIPITILINCVPIATLTKPYYNPQPIVQTHGGERAPSPPREALQDLSNFPPLGANPCTGLMTGNKAMPFEKDTRTSMSAGPPLDTAHVRDAPLAEGGFYPSHAPLHLCPEV